MFAAKTSAGVINTRRNREIIQQITALDGLRTVEGRMIVNARLASPSHDETDARRSHGEQYDCAWLRNRGD
jgi:hypothetical protein